MIKALSTLCSTIYQIAHSLIAYFLAGTVALIFLVPALILMAVPERIRPYRTIFRLLDICYKGALWASGIPIDIRYEGRIPESPAVIVANHQSSLDVPLVGALMNGHPHMWYVLEYYAKKPLIHFLVRRIGVSVRTEPPEAAARSLVSGIRLMQQHAMHAIIFPEGQRTIDGTVHEFFNGFAIIAKKTGRPVVPVYLNNPGANYPPGAFFVRSMPIHIVVGPEFYYKQDDTLESFSVRVYGWYVARQR